MHAAHNHSAPSAAPAPAIESFSEGATLFAAGEDALRFYILLEGSIALTRGHEPPVHLRGRHAFGIEGIINPSGVYPCTARALEPCRVATYQADMVDDLLQNSPRTLQLIVQGLSHVLEASWLRLGRNHPGEMQTQFVGRIQTVGPGQWVMQDGERSKEIYRIISTDKGLEVVKNGNQLAVIREPGEIFGEMACLLNEGRTAGIRSLGNSVLEVYSPEQLLAMLSDYPDFSLRLVTTLAQRLAKTSRELAEIKGTMAASTSDT
jgi:CRP-like cAMP-binding protein